LLSIESVRVPPQASEDRGLPMSLIAITNVITIRGDPNAPTPVVAMPGPPRTSPAFLWTKGRFHAVSRSECPHPKVIREGLLFVIPIPGES